MTPINDASERAKALEAHKAWRAAFTAYNAAQDPEHDLPETIVVELEQAYEDYQDARNKALAAFEKRRGEILAAAPEHANLATLESALRKAEEGTEQAGELLFDEDGEPVLCAISGLPIWDHEEYLEDTVTGEVVIRALVLPPRPEVEEDDEDGKLLVSVI